MIIINVYIYIKIMIEIIFCDTAKKFTDACEDLIKANPHLLKHYKLSTYNSSVTELKAQNVAFISPANSYGSMGGGIDYVYSRIMFPNIQKVVMDKIKNLKKTGVLEQSFDKLTKNNKYSILPIGEAIITHLKDYQKYSSCYLITAPTMEHPMNIEGTNNPYKAFIASIKLAENCEYKSNIKTVVCPGLGTGVGGIQFVDSATQIFQALNDHVAETKN
jgi:O-acetyl-ADP-ribose deacetylase (regulator of RNase III)